VVARRWLRLRLQPRDRTTATRRLLFAIAIPFVFLAGNLIAQVTLVPPFVGTNSETWEEFGETGLPDGTIILGGLATISGRAMGTEEHFLMCSVVAKPSDGQLLMDSDRPTTAFTISFSQPISAFGAYWGSGYHCQNCCGFPDASSIITFYDVNGNVVGSDSFKYSPKKSKNGKRKPFAALMWRGYQFSTPVKTIVRVAGDGSEGFAVDGLQATVASTANEPTPP
jgi:hypothetical protein